MNENEDANELPLPPPEHGVWNDLRDAIRGVQFDYTEGRLGRAILLLSVPMMLEMSMESVFAVVDVFFVLRLGPAAAATVGVTEAMLTILYALAIGLSMGTTAMVARRVGEKDLPAAAVAAVQAIALGIMLAAAVGVFGGFFAEDLLVLMGASDEMVAEGTTYTRVMFGTNVVIFLIFLINAVFRGAGDASMAMKSLWIANVANIILDPCLIFGLGPFPELGLTGAAVATSIGRGIGVAYQLRGLAGSASRIRITTERLRLVIPVMWRLFRVSAFGIFQFLVSTASWVGLVRIISSFGEEAVAGYTLAIRILIFFFLPAWGMSNAAATLVGQNLGAGNPDRAEKSVWMTARYNMAFLGSVGLIFIFFAEPIIALFTDDPAVAGYGVDCLRIVSYGYLLYALGMVVVQAFNGAGDTVTPTYINVLCFWLIQIPLA
ncbi:MAG: MATE family efflux transporter, partial [Rhodothermales bacterium]|nr:MATE family efflux transporter [Rhodothermales bacterium]